MENHSGDAEKQAKRERDREYARLWKQKHPEKVLAYARAHRLRNKDNMVLREKARLYKVQWKHANKAKIKEYQNRNRERTAAHNRARYFRNRDKIDAQKKVWRKKNFERLSQYWKEWRLKNHPRILAQEKESYKRRRQDWKYVLKHRLRQRIRSAIKAGRNNAKKYHTTIELLGCSVFELRNHLENLFTPGMCWEDVVAGRIHIDHKRPCASFDLTDPEQQKQCFHYTNLQPLWARDNLRKKDTYAG